VLPPPAKREPDPLERDVLIVISKLKNYVRARSGFNTSDRVVEPLSDAVRELCERAIEKARAEGRKTVLERDFE
jgi:histone H3/H4